jgi:hypothetical protein
MSDGDDDDDGPLQREEPTREPDPGQEQGTGLPAALEVAKSEAPQWYVVLLATAFMLLFSSFGVFQVSGRAMRRGPRWG